MVQAEISSVAMVAKQVRYPFVAFFAYTAMESRRKMVIRVVARESVSKACPLCRISIGGVVMMMVIIMHVS